MAIRHFSMRGEVIDMNKLRTVNATTPALGNAKVNARGDILGAGGIVIKTQEQIEAEWAANKKARDESVRPADIKAETMIKPEKRNQPAAPSAADFAAKNIQAQRQPTIKPTTVQTPAAVQASTTPELQDDTALSEEIDNTPKEKTRRKISESDV